MSITKLYLILKQEGLVEEFIKHIEEGIEKYDK